MKFKKLRSVLRLTSKLPMNCIILGVCQQELDTKVFPVFSGLRDSCLMPCCMLIDQVDSAISDSISFGRFENESLSWERRSSFSHNRYLEEVEKFSKPGSVNEKKAYFEAHFKKKGGLLGQNSAESHTFDKDVLELVNQGEDNEIINKENHDDPFDDRSVSSQNHGYHVTEIEEMPKPGISSPNPKFENSFSSVGGSVSGDLNGANAQINEQDDSGGNKFSTFVGDDPEVEIKQDVNNMGMSENTPSEAMESVPKLVKKTGKCSSGSRQTLTPKVQFFSLIFIVVFSSQKNILVQSRGIF